MTKDNQKPNIIIILADDLGYSDLGCYGSEIKTPNIDNLGNNGIKFSQFYNQARCSPSRASLMTGLTGHQAGVGQLSGDLGAPGYRGFINNYRELKRFVYCRVVLDRVRLVSFSLFNFT